MGNPVVHFEIVHKDAKQLQAFYAEVEGPQATLDQIEKLGGTTVMGPDEVMRWNRCSSTEVRMRSRTRSSGRPDEVALTASLWPSGSRPFGPIDGTEDFLAWG